MEIKSLHTHVDIVTRTGGGKVIPKAAYNARDRLRDNRYGKLEDYSKIDDLVFSKIFLPEHVPKKFSDRELVLCQEIVQDKKRKFYYPTRTSFSLDWLVRYNFSNSLGDKYPQ